MVGKTISALTEFARLHLDQVSYANCFPRRRRPHRRIAACANPSDLVRRATIANEKRQFRGVPRTRHLLERTLASPSVFSFITSSRGGASCIIRLRCSGLGSVIFAFSRSLTRRSASIRACAQP